MSPLRFLTVLLCAASLYLLWPLWPPLLLAAWTAALTRPLLVRFGKVLKGRRRAAAALSLSLFIVMALPLMLVALGVVSGARELLATLQTSPSAIGALQSITSTPGMPFKMPSTLPDFVALAQRSGTEGLEVLTLVAGAAATGVIGLILFFGGAYSLLLDSSELWAWLKKHSPLDDKAMERLGAAFHETGRGLLVGVGLTSLVQGTAATLIYASLGVPRALVLGPITGIASVIPMVGTSLVWAPLALGLFLSDKQGKALVLVLLGVVVISAIDNLLRPYFSKLGALQLPMFVLFAAAFGGLAVFGTWGAILGPLTVRLTLEALTLIKEAESAESPTSAP